jgi:XTP/dITP diphosphohydrolase
VSGRQTIPPGTALLIATRNAHKALEIRQVLPAGFHFFTLADFPGAPAVVEDGATFAANAAKKAAALADWLASNPHPIVAAVYDRRQLPFYILADDSGLEVDALNGAPGVHSARFAALDTGAAANSSDTANNAKLLRLLDGLPPERRAARFRCVLALRELPPPAQSHCSHSSHPSHPSHQSPPAAPPAPLLFEAVCPGRIALRPAGAGGFGYDPLFIPDGRTQSFAELGEAVKNTLSHRALALEKLRQYLAKPGN